MIAQIIPFPPRGPFAVHIERDGAAWLVVARDHGWLHGDRRNALAEAQSAAAGFGVAVEIINKIQIRSRRAPLRARIPAIHSAAAQHETWSMKMPNAESTKAVTAIDTETENILAAVKEEVRFDKFLKFNVGKAGYFISKEEVPPGTEFLAHTVSWTKSWLKFVDGELVDKKLYRIAKGDRPIKRDDLDEIEKANTDDDPWSIHYLIPFENMQTGAVVIFTTSSIGGRGAVSDLCETYANRKIKGNAGQPIIKLAVGELPSKKHGPKPAPKFKIVGWDDGSNDAHEISETTIPITKVADDMDDEIPF